MEVSRREREGIWPYSAFCVQPLSGLDDAHCTGESHLSHSVHRFKCNDTPQCLPALWEALSPGRIDTQGNITQRATFGLSEALQ